MADLGPNDNDKEKERERDKLGGDSYEKQKQKRDKGQENQRAEEKREVPAYKYKGHEAVIIKGKSVFLKIEPDGIKTTERIEEQTRVIVPPSEEEYPYIPYQFISLAEVARYLRRAQLETIDSLYKEVQIIASDYNQQSEHKVRLLGIDILCSYSQDRLPTTHYDVIRGDNGTGKSSYGDTFEAIGYRPVVLTDPNAAQIIRILGCVEPGQCTLVSDESGLEDDRDLVAILKQGYKLRGKTAKINDYSRKPEYYHSYCFKIIISDKNTNLRELKGVFDRSFEMVVYKGKPKYDIKETTEPQGNAKRLARFDKLQDFRKLMLLYRLVHYNDPIPDIDVGVDGRDKELVKPILQIFYGSKAQEEVVKTLQHFLDERNEKKDIELQRMVGPTTLALLNEKKVDQVLLKDVWNEVKKRIDGGMQDPKKPNEYHTEELGTIYNKTVSSILENIFGGKPKRTQSGLSYTFDLEELRSIVESHKSKAIIAVTGEHNDDNDDNDDKRSSRGEHTDPQEGNSVDIERENKGKDGGCSSPKANLSSLSSLSSPTDIDEFEAQLKRRKAKAEELEGKGG